MEFTIEQLEKIINEAPEGAEYYYHSEDELYKYRKKEIPLYYFRDGGIWKPSMNKGYSEYIINNSQKLTDLAEQLQGMKMQEEAKQVEWKNGDDVAYGADTDCHTFIGYTADGMACVRYNTVNSFFEIPVSEIHRPPTPEQKQAQIDERNGELFFNMASKTKSAIESGFFHSWHKEDSATKSHYIDIAKQIDFIGKLSA